MPAKVFVDGREGTTGLEIADLLQSRSDLELLSLDSRFRKDVSAKHDIFEEAEIVFLCLPDDAAKEAVNIEVDTRFIDASTAHRVADAWVYGLPELSESQRAEISLSGKVANPGCYPTGIILAIRPLVDANWLSADQPTTVHAVSGYSGGGKTLIGKYHESANNRLDTRCMV